MERLRIIKLQNSLCGKIPIYQFNQQIVQALDPLWMDKNSNDLLLPTIPKINNTYNLILTSSLEIDLSRQFWSIYLPPNATLNGIKNEEDIQTIHFCKVQPIGLLQKKKETAIIRIKVVDSIDVKQAVHYKNPIIEWIILLENNHGQINYYDTTNFENYAIVEINIESDLGLTIIVKKEPHQCYIVAVNEWGFHRNYWYLYHRKLSPQTLKKYGIL